MSENDISAIERLLEPVSQNPPPRMTPLLAERPDWDTLEIQPVSWGFHTWALRQLPDIVALAAIPDDGQSVNRYAVIQPEPENPGRYRVSVCYPDADPDRWLLGPPRHRMDIRAAHELMGRLVAGTAG